MQSFNLYLDFGHCLVVTSSERPNYNNNKNNED